jgi:hypothetical protein
MVLNSREAEGCAGPLHRCFGTNGHIPLSRSPLVAGNFARNSIAVPGTLAQTTGIAHPSPDAALESELAVEELGRMLNFIADEKVKRTRSPASNDGPGFTKKEALWLPRN